MARRLPIEYERAKGVVISSTGKRTKVELGIRAKGRKVLKGGEAYRLREPQVLILTFLVPKMPILMLKTAIFGTLIHIFQYDSLARPHLSTHLSIHLSI